MLAPRGASVIPQYFAVGGAPASHPAFGTWADPLTPQSCLNGWTMGNILTTAAGLAKFYADLWAGKLISEASLKQMFTFKPLTKGTVPPPGTPYGLGQMVFQFSMDSTHTLTFIGHGGEDWGSGFPSAAWVHELNISLTIGINNGESQTGMPRSKVDSLGMLTRSLTSR